MFALGASLSTPSPMIQAIVCVTFILSKHQFYIRKVL